MEEVKKTVDAENEQNVKHNVKVLNDYIAAAAKKAKARAEAEEKARQAEEAMKEYERREQLRRCESDLKETRKKLKTIEAFYPVAFCVAFVIGFIMGLVLAVSQLLRFHGPTVTFFGTLAAFVIYLVVGTGFGAGFAWLVFDWYKTTTKDCRLRIKAIKSKIEELTSKQPAKKPSRKSTGVK